ncbi:hypothetical protein IAT40_005213 [Kwoniella sp. CBS 6097]
MMDPSHSSSTNAGTCPTRTGTDIPSTQQARRGENVVGPSLWTYWTLKKGQNGSHYCDFAALVGRERQAEEVTSHNEFFGYLKSTIDDAITFCQTGSSGRVGPGPLSERIKRTAEPQITRLVDETPGVQTTYLSPREHIHVSRYGRYMGERAARAAQEKETKASQERDSSASQERDGSASQEQVEDRPLLVFGTNEDDPTDTFDDPKLPITDLRYSHRPTSDQPSHTQSATNAFAHKVWESIPNKPATFGESGAYALLSADKQGSDLFVVASSVLDKLPNLHKAVKPPHSTEGPYIEAQTSTGATATITGGTSGRLPAAQSSNSHGSNLVDL